MICDDVITLVGESPAARRIFEPYDERRRQVFCQINSVGRAEYWRASSNGIEPSYVFRLSEAADYQGEKIVIWRDQRWRVVRSYVTGHAIELTVAPATVDAVVRTRTGEEADDGGQT